MPDESTNTLMLYELYADRASFEVHAATRRIAEHRERAHPMLAKKRLVVCDVVDS